MGNKRGTSQLRALLRAQNVFEIRSELFSNEKLAKGALRALKLLQKFEYSVLGPRQSCIYCHF